MPIIQLDPRGTCVHYYMCITLHVYLSVNILYIMHVELLYDVLYLNRESTENLNIYFLCRYIRSLHIATHGGYP